MGTLRPLAYTNISIGVLSLVGGHRMSKRLSTIEDAREADARAKNSEWIGHLLRYARDQLRSQGLTMLPDGTIRPVPTKQEVSLAAVRGLVKTTDSVHKKSPADG
jgi:hypothetical protein